MADWSTRIPAAIEEGKKLLGGDEYVLIPPHTRGNDTGFTVVLTAGEVALAEALWQVACEETPPDIAADYPALIAYTEKIEAMSSPVHRRS